MYLFQDSAVKDSWTQEKYRKQLLREIETGNNNELVLEAAKKHYKDLIKHLVWIRSYPWITTEEEKSLMEKPRHDLQIIKHFLEKEFEKVKTCYEDFSDFVNDYYGKEVHN